MALVELFHGGMSYHVALITRLKDLMGSWKPFRAFNSWFKKQEVRNLIQEAWKIRIIGNPLSG